MWDTWLTSHIAIRAIRFKAQQAVAQRGIPLSGH